MKLSTKQNEREITIFERVQNASARMTQLVEDLLDYSLVAVSLQDFEKIDLNVKVDKVLDDLDLVIQEKAAQITVGQLPVISGNRRQVEQLFQNLLSNALKYSKTSVAPKIEITSKPMSGKEVEGIFSKEIPDNEYHCVAIKDNGIGFDQIYADKIFQVFQRLHGKSEYQGTGVGLAFVKKVMQNHKGFITVESAPGVGTIFKVFFPL